MDEKGTFSFLSRRNQANSLHCETWRHSNQELAQRLGTEAGYFERNAERMRYCEFQRQGLFVGSGVIEAGCKTIIGQRLKQSGMFWTVAGANQIMALRCNRLSGRCEDYWKSRARAA